MPARDTVRRDRRGDGRRLAERYHRCLSGRALSEADRPLERRALVDRPARLEQRHAGGAGGRIFVCAEKTTLICLDAEDGKILWQRDNDYDDVKAADPNAEVPARIPNTNRSNGYSSFTPFSDGKHVWAAFGNGVLACYDMEGNRKWIRFVDVPPHKGWGGCSSPMVVDGKLLLHIDALKAFEPTTGKPLWSQPKAKWSWGTPIPATVGDVTVVVVSGGAVVRVSDGEVMPAKVKKLAYNSPMVIGDIAYMIQKGGGAYKLKTTGDGEVTAEKLWTVEVSKDRHYGSPVLANGLLFDIDQKGNLAVIDATNGEIVHTRKLDLGGATSYQSPTLVGDCVLVANESGATMILKADKAATEVATVKLGAYRASPVVVGNRMYIRTHKTMYCFGK